MVRAPFFDKNGLKKGAWSQEEDDKLRAYVERYGHWNWRQLPKFSGLTRCGKSCRLRWMNYLRPGVRHGNYCKQEEDLIIKLHEQLGNKWSTIAAKLPGRTDNEVKNYWHTHLKKRVKQNQNEKGEVIKTKQVGANAPSHLILESTPLSSETSSNEFSLVTDDSALITPSDVNWSSEDSLISFQLFEDFCEYFWTEPFVTDNMYNGDSRFMSPYVSYQDYQDDSIDLLYQVVQELPGT